MDYWTELFPEFNGIKNSQLDVEEVYGFCEGEDNTFRDGRAEHN